MIEIICVRGTGDKEMSPIDEELITSEFMAVKRGTYEIDKQWYLIKNSTIQAPHKKTDNIEALMDNDIIEIQDPHFGITGKRIVRSIRISGTASDLYDAITLADFEEFV